ncbi:DUF1365 domain-containing protein [Yoonia sp. MH D7]
MKSAAEHIVGITTHSRRGEIRHRFRYGVDYVLIDPDIAETGPKLFSRNRFNLASVYDCDHGGPLKDGKGVQWAHDVFSSAKIVSPDLQIKLLTQPRFMGHVFNPVSFWLAFENGGLIAVIAEVSTPFGDRHSYLCHAPEFTPITSETLIKTPKSLHVSPFQEVTGSYEFTFDITPESIAIRILHRNGDEGVIASLVGSRVAMTNRGLIRASLRRPLGGLRTTALIYWQALRLKFKGAQYRDRPTPPKNEVT